MIALALSACFPFDSAVDRYCEKHRDQCPDGGAAGGQAGGSAGGVAGGTAGGVAGGSGGGAGGGGGGSGGGQAGGGAAVIDAGITNPQRPTAVGFPQVGQLLIGSSGTWIGADDFDYSWSVVLPDAGSRSEASGLTFTPSVGDLDGTAYFVVTGKNDAGYLTATSASGIGPIRRRPHPDFVTGFEHGGTILSDRNPANPSFAGANAVTVSTARTGRGALSIVAGSGSEGYWQLSPPPSQVAVLRFYVLLEVAGTAGDLAVLSTAAGQLSVYWNGSQLQLRSGTSFSSTLPMSVAQWHRVELRADFGSPWKGEWQLDGAPGVPLVVSGTAAVPIDVVQLGRGASAMQGQLTARYDDFAYSNDPLDFPMGAGAVQAIPLARAGVHSREDRFRCRTAAANDPCVAGMTYASLINDWPSDGLTWLEQVTGDDAAYLEHFPADAGAPPLPAPNAVRFVMQVEASNSVPVPGFNLSTVYVMGSTPNVFSSFTDNRPWLPNELGSTPVRVGFQGANGTAHVHGVLIEADLSQP